MARPSISVKLSAMHPRFDPGKEERLVRELLPRIVELAAAARRFGLGLTIDAEEQDRLDLTLGLFAAAFMDPALAAGRASALPCRPTASGRSRCCAGCGGWPSRAGKRIPVRLVKGAYWDSEIKWAQERGLADYPVLDAQAPYRCVLPGLPRLMLSDRGRCSIRSSPPTTPTPSPRSSVAAPRADSSNSSACTAWAKPLYEEIVGSGKLGVPCRIYAPVGRHDDLRRLSGAASAGERRQHLLRQSPGRR